MSYQSTDVIYKGHPHTIGSSQTEYIISNLIEINDPLNLAVVFEVSAVAIATGIFVTIQTSANSSAWYDVKSVSLGGTTSQYLTTFLARSSTGDGDYISYVDHIGTRWAASAQITNLSPAPTGAIWNSIPPAQKVRINLTAISGATAIRNAFIAALNALPGFPSKIVLGSVATVQMSSTGTTLGLPNLVMASHNANDTGPGSMLTTQMITPSGPGEHLIRLSGASPADGAFLPLLPKARVVISTGAGDSISISNVWVARQLST